MNKWIDEWTMGVRSNGWMLTIKSLLVLVCEAPFLTSTKSRGELEISYLIPQPYMYQSTLDG